MCSDLPGFIIRASELQFLPVENHIPQLLSSLNSLQVADSPFVLQKKRSLLNVSREVGDLHSDTLPFSFTNLAVDVHMTAKGQGQVLMANAGLSASDLIPEAISEDSNKVLASSPLGPRVLLNPVYKSDFGEGDTIFMRFVNNHGPIIHRFDTTSRSRASWVHILYPTVNKEGVISSTEAGLRGPQLGLRHRVAHNLIEYLEKFSIRS